jgi:hypothetical protein
LEKPLNAKIKKSKTKNAFKYPNSNIRHPPTRRAIAALRRDGGQKIFKYQARKIGCSNLGTSPVLGSWILKLYFDHFPQKRQKTPIFRVNRKS